MINHQHSRQFRTDINGLRAWAVLAVVLYHFGIPGFGGGFVGVDVFFVISGFLMTRIIISKLDTAAGSAGFSIVGFYLARARRIIPALLALCATLLIIGWFVLPPTEYYSLGNHVVSALTFISNIKFWQEAGYFDVASHEKWLLHTWSLSVEWQFYLILPLMLVAVWKLRPGRQFATALIGAVFIASLAFSMVLTPGEPGAAFYLLPTRAWEMLAGGIVYLVPHRIVLSEKGKQRAELLGFGLIVSSILMFSSETTWPGSWAIVPVLGAMLVLYAEQTESAWTGSRPAQWLGTRSYSLYLWHWPVVVTLVYIDAQQNAQAVALGLAVTLVLGELSFRLIEDPVRNYLENFTWRMGTATIVISCLAVAIPALYVRLHSGISGRLAPEVESIFNEANNKNPRIKECFVLGPKPVPNCTYGGPELGAIVIGDSHAASVMRAVEEVLPEKRLHVLDWSLAKCPTLIGAQKLPGADSPNCGQFVSSSLARQATLPKDVPLIIMNRTSIYAFGYNDKGSEKTKFPFVYFKQPVSEPTPSFLEEFRAAIVDTACAFAETRPVYLVRPIPELKVDVPKAMGRALQTGVEHDVSISIDEYRKRHAVVFQAQDAAREKCGVRILDPLPLLCSDGRCHGSKNGRPLYYDDDHLSEYGGQVLKPMFAEVFADKRGHNMARED